MSNSTIETKTNGAAETKNETKPPTPLADRLAEGIAEVRDSLKFLAHNMHEAFDGALESNHANAYAALTAVHAHLVTLDEDMWAVGIAEQDRKISAKTPEGAPRVRLGAWSGARLREELPDDLASVSKVLDRLTVLVQRARSGLEGGLSGNVVPDLDSAAENVRELYQWVRNMWALLPAQPEAAE